MGSQRPGGELAGAAATAAQDRRGGHPKYPHRRGPALQRLSRPSRVPTARTPAHCRTTSVPAATTPRTTQNPTPERRAALRGVPLLRWLVAAICPQPLLDEPGERVELRSTHRRRAPVARRNGRIEASSSRSGVRSRSGAPPRPRSSHPDGQDGPCDKAPSASRLANSRVNPPALPVTGKGCQTGRVLLRRAGNIPPLPWSTFAPPFACPLTGAKRHQRFVCLRLALLQRVRALAAHYH